MEEIENWISKVKETHPNLKGHSICPFAKTDTYKILQSSIDDIQPLNEKFGVVIFIVEDDLTEEYVLKKVKELNVNYPEYIFLEDLKNRPTFINGVQTNNGKYNLILYQNAKFLIKMRHFIATTTYFDLWDNTYLKKILGKDYEDIQKIRRTHSA